MSGVWSFKDNVMRRIENPLIKINARKVLVYIPTNEVITSYALLEEKLTALGWERYYDNPNLLQYHISLTRKLISLPLSFSKFKTMHMYDIIVKTNDKFEVRDPEQLD